jgi:5-methyltetrahydropteroyltriglutamate--homocysteine methyltransferase
MTEIHRANVVGSLLRPDALKEARAARDAGTMSPADFKRIEDAAVDEAIAAQERAGVDVVTDGEMRRLFFFGPLTEAAEGVSASEGSTVVWHDEHGGTPSVQPAALTMPIRQTRSLATEEYAYARARATLPLKVTLPSPLMFGLLWKPGVSDAVYPSVFDAFQAGAEIVRGEAQALIAMGCEEIQIDAPELATLVDPEQRAFYETVGAPAERLLTEGVDLLDDMVAGLDARLSMHLCRGNYAGRWMSEGGYEEISSQVFRRATNYDTFLLEYDDHRSGSFEPLRDVPDDKVVGLGLVSTKRAELEPAEELVGRIDEAAGHFPREQLSLCTQCGFASTWEGNPVDAAVQDRKLALVAEVARRAWPG